MSSLFTGSRPWMEKVVFEALLGTATTEQQRPKLVQVMSISSVLDLQISTKIPSPQRIRGRTFALSDGHAHMVAVVQETTQGSKTKTTPISRGCVARIRDWHICPLSVLLPASASEDASVARSAHGSNATKVVGLFLGEPPEVLGGQGLGIFGDPQSVHETVQVRRALQSLLTATSSAEGAASFQDRVNERLIRRGSRLEQLLSFATDPSVSQPQYNTTTASAAGENLPIGNVEALFASQSNESALDALWRTSSSAPANATTGSRRGPVDQGFHVEKMQGGTSFVVTDVQQMQNLFDGVIQAAAGGQEPAPAPPAAQPSSRRKSPPPPPQPTEHGVRSLQQQQVQDEFLDDDDDEGMEEEDDTMAIGNMLMSQDEPVPMETQRTESVAEAGGDEDVDGEEESETHGLETQLPSAPVGFDTNDTPSTTGRSTTIGAGPSRRSTSDRRSQRMANAESEQEENDDESQDVLETQPVSAPAPFVGASTNGMGGAHTMALGGEGDDEAVNMDLVQLGICAPRRKDQPMSSMEELWRRTQKQPSAGTESNKKPRETGGLAGDSLRALCQPKKWDPR